MASPSFLGCPLKLNDTGGRSLSSLLSDKCTVNRTMWDPDLPQSGTKQPVTPLDEDGGQQKRTSKGQEDNRSRRPATPEDEDEADAACKKRRGRQR